MFLFLIFASTPVSPELSLVAARLTPMYGPVRVDVEEPGLEPRRSAAVSAWELSEVMGSAEGSIQSSR